MATREERAEKLRPAVKAFVHRTSWREAARALGVSTGAVRNLLAGSTPQSDTLERIEEQARSIGLLVPDEETPEEALAADPFAQWLNDLEQMVRNVGGRDGKLDPAEKGARQRDIVNGLITARKQRGAEVPAELYALLGRLEHGDL